MILKDCSNFLMKRKEGDISRSQHLRCSGFAHSLHVEINYKYVKR